MRMTKRSSNRLRCVETLEPRQLLAGVPVISEIMASNDLTLFDEDGESSDWLELHNPTEEPINLNGWHLTDDFESLAKWTLPSVTLGPYEYLTVFASGKDRTAPGSNLHTNFKLSADGEYIALTNTVGEVIHSYGDQYPVQSTDVSFGLQTPQFNFVGPDATGKSLVPTSADAGADWTSVNFNDASWNDISGAIGFDERSAIDNAGFEEGDLNTWQVFGGAVAATDSIGIVPTQGNFQARLDAFQNAKSRSQMENFLGLDRFSLDVVGEGTANRGTVMKREFTVEAGDVIDFDWNLVTNEPIIGGNLDFALFTVSPGVGGIKIADVGQEMQLSQSTLIRETGYQKFSHTFADAGTFTVGFGIVNMESSGGESSLLLDNIRINGRGEASGLYTDRIVTNVQDLLKGVNSSIWSRYEFNVDSIDDVDSLLVRAQYDDGVGIYLNGQQLTRQNAPDALAWNSAALSDRDEDDALSYQDHYFGGGSSILQVGKNVLAVQGLTESIDDATAFFQIELFGIGKIRETAAFFESPTPGSPNFTSNFNVTDDVMFSVQHGIHDSAFPLTLTTSTADASIYYTVDGSVPSISNGVQFDGPFTIDNTTIVRAVATKSGLRDSSAKTQTYIFLEDTITQSDADAIALGFPDSWGAFDPPRWPVKEADYEMDPQILGDQDRYNGKYDRRIEESLKSIPTLSLVMDVDDIFGPTGFHQDPRNRGPEWERPTSVELIYPDGAEGFQIDAGIRIQGGVSRVISQKQSFRLLFKDDYGASKLTFPFFGEGAAETFDSITLRSSTGEFLLLDSGNPGMHYIRDEQLRRSQLATGNLAAHGNFMHLYINGLYWGVYNPVERMDGQFAANYLGGNKDDYDVLNAADFVSEPDVSPLQGSTDAWNAFVDLTKQMERVDTQAEKTALYLQLQGLNPDGTRNPDFEIYLDRDNLIDYLITQVYSRNTDWPIRNYYVLRQRGPDSTGFKFMTWDGEFTLDSGQAAKGRMSSVDGSGVGVVYQGLQTSDLFKTHFSDRVTELFSPGGALYTNPDNQQLDPEHPEDNVPLARYLKLVDEVESALVAEGARWGDQTVIYWQDPFQNLNPIVFTPDERWRPVVQFNVDRFFPTRASLFTRTLASEDHNRRPPTLPIPNFSDTIANISIDPQFGSKVYYTLDGSDPMQVNGDLSDVAVEFTEPFQLLEATTVTARSVNTAGQWSAVSSNNYLTESVPADVDTLRITEINYNPHAAFVSLGEADVDNDEFEFIEIQNIGTLPTDLSGVHLIRFARKGVSFTFGDQILGPGERVVVPRNLAAFTSRYPTDGITMAIGTGGTTEYSSGISNSGDLLTLRDARGRTIQQFAFSDSGDWPGRADGNASSLEVLDVRGNYEDASNYRNSSEFGGSPGWAGLGPDNRIVVNEILSNSDGNQLDQIELFNRTLKPIDISGWYLSDSNGDYLKYRLPSDNPLEVGRFAVFNENQTGFRLNSVTGDDVYLIEANADGRPRRFVDRIQFDATAPGVTLGRVPNGSGQLYPMAEMTLGSENSGPMHGDIVITEIQYDPGDPDGPGVLTDTSMEYIELFNRSSVDVDVSEWHIRGDADFDIADGTTIGPGKTLTLVAFDPENDAATLTLFRLLFSVDANASLIGPLDGDLSNTSGTVRLLRPEQPSPESPDVPYSLIDEVRYDSKKPWPDAIGASNRSLHRNDVNAWGNDGRNWQLGAESPSRQNFTRPVVGDLNSDRLVNAADIDFMCGAIHSGNSDSALDLNGDGTVDLSDYSYLVRDILYSLPGDSNLDRAIDSSDLVMVFIRNEYEDGVARNSTWESGDWNCNREFDTRDLVDAFMTGRYSSPPARPGLRPVRLPVFHEAKTVDDRYNRIDVDDDYRPVDYRSRYASEPIPYYGQTVDRLFDRIDPVWVPDADTLGHLYDNDDAEELL